MTAYQRIKPPVPAVAPPGGCERLACCIPFCGRTFRNDKKGTPWQEGMIVMCGKHWRTAPAEIRQRDRKLRRLLRKIGRLLPSARHRRMWSVVARWNNQNWERARQVVAERAGGIG